MTISANIALLGCSPRAQSQAGYQSTDRRWKIESCSDSDRARGMKFRDRYSIPKYFEDHVELLEQERPHLAVVDVPIARKVEVILQALKCGCHVLVVPPLAFETTQTEQVLAAARQAGRTVFVGNPLRNVPPALRARALVDNGELGEVALGKCRLLWHSRHHSQNAAAIMDPGILVLDVLLWLMGTVEPAAVTGNILPVQKPPRINNGLGADQLYMTLYVRFKGGQVLIAEASNETNLHSATDAEQTLVGSTGTATFSLTESGESNEVRLYLHDHMRAFRKADTRPTPPAVGMLFRALASLDTDPASTETLERYLAVHQIVSGAFQSHIEQKEICISNDLDLVGR
ncbi:MAG: Gfo/Idh/MocA family oxidoreductase [Candidatus Sumerlaeaceae bacterium]|nr:Gfo/Idh/MocA family oxidoreductase [Candidatus Sumerlaeaceae bacterium]